MKKIKYLCLTLVLSFLLTVPAFASQPHFSDVTDRAACAEAVTYLAENAIVNGTGNNCFQPNTKITVSQWAAMLCRAFGTPETGSTWAERSIQQACHAGWLNVTALQTPNDRVCRAVLYESAFAAAMIPVYDSVLYGGVTEMDAGATKDVLAQFGDYRSVANWAKESLAFCYYTNILDQSALKIEPTKAILRCEIAQMLYNMLVIAELI